MSRPRPEPVTIRFRDPVRAEITKILTHPATGLALLITLVANTSLAVLAVTDAVRLGVSAHPTRLSDLGSVMFSPVYAFLVVAATAAGSEHPDKQIQVTLTAVPGRTTLVTSKLVALLTVTAPAAVVTVGPARLIIAASARTGGTEALVDVARWTSTYLLMSVITFGFAGLTRSSIIPIGVLVLGPVLVATGVFQWAQIIRFLPDQASLSLLGHPGYDVTALPPTVAALTLTTWAAALTVTYTITLHRRDA